MKSAAALCILLAAFGTGLKTREVQTEDMPTTICCAGDSLMRPVPVHLKVLLRDSKRKFFIRDWAQGGLSSETYQSFYRRRLENWKDKRPDFILIQLGTNDVFPLCEGKYTLAQFEKNLKTIIRNFKGLRGGFREHPEILIATAPLFLRPIATPDKNRMVEDGVNPAIRKVARQEDVVLVDNFAVLNKKPHLYDPDGVHPNSEGERALAKNWLSHIKREARSKN